MKNETDALTEAILALQEQRDTSFRLMKEHLEETIEGLKPINLFKSMVKEIFSSSELKRDIVDNAIGLGTGFISRQLIVGGSHNIIKKLVGTMLQFAITNVVSKNAEGIQNIGQSLLYRFLKNRKDTTSEVQYNGKDPKNVDRFK